VAHITYIKVAGLAGRKKDIEISFDRQVNVFFGVNGVGKTTLLKILHSALKNDPHLVFGLPFNHAEVGIYSLDAKRELIREYKNAPDNDQEDLFEEISVVVRERLIREKVIRGARRSWKVKNKKGADIEEGAFAHEYLPTTRLISVSDMAAVRRGAEAQSEEANINKMMEAQLQQQWVRYFSPLQAKAQDVQQKGIARILSTVLAPDSIAEESTELGPEVAYNLTKSFLSSHLSSRMPSTKAAFLEKYESDKRLAAVVNQIAVIEREVENIHRPRDQLQLLLNKLFLNKKVDLSGGTIKVLLGREGGGQLPLRLSQLSSGEKQALYILIHALRASRNSLIIDEPELSMHIDWQRQLIDSIAILNQDAQIVMATHSPEVMATVPDNCIFEI
jgi:predicted ATP-dependent endonuclease of OLD family